MLHGTQDEGGVGAPLRAFGSRVALLAPDGPTVTYAELADRVDAAAEALGPIRRLVAIEMTTDVESIVWYLAVVLGGHVGLLLEPHGTGVTGVQQALADTYDPDVVVRGGRAEMCREGSRHELHPDLRLLLSTSGSTGSPKVVRLSRENLRSNALAIAAYLGLDETERAALALPLHYCYGLSVVNSHLSVGASLVLTDMSVVADRFWSICNRFGVTSFAGVPYTFELLERIGFTTAQLPTLRYLTQAGGAMPPDRVRRFADAADRDGWRLFVMYGQTEATARMAYVPPALVASHPDTIGITIDGGSFRIDGNDDGSDGVGELVYRGPNVMLGYADGPGDLALGRTIDELHTGDLASRDADGLYRIVGRASRFLKLFGKRVDLGVVEQRLARSGVDAVCSGTDDRLVVAVREGDAATCQSLLMNDLDLPRTSVHVVKVDDYPRTATGKLDYPALAAITAEPPAATTRAAGSVRAIYGQIFGREDIDDDDTFVTLGGDSLSYVEASIAIEELIGSTPANWHVASVRELDGLDRTRSRISRMETNVVLRALAIVVVVATHFGALTTEGGANVLLVIAGWNLARFQLTGESAGSPRRILVTTAHIVVPAWAIMVISHSWSLTHALFIGEYLQAPGANVDGYWFIDVLVYLLVATALLLCIRPIRRLVVADPLRAALGLCLLAFAVRGAAAIREHTTALTAHTTELEAWKFTFGMVLLYCTTVRRRLLASVVAAVGILGAFESTFPHTFPFVCVLILVWVPTVPVPRPLNRAIGWIAGASLYIYLTHWMVTERLTHVNPWLRTAVGVVGGVAIWAVVEQVALRRITRARAAARTCSPSERLPLRT